MIKQVKRIMIKGGVMTPRKFFIICPVLSVFFLFLLFVPANADEESADPCADMECGPGYAAILQSNGSCMCVYLDCDGAKDCPKPQEAPDDCASVEGCPKPPALINP